MMCICSDNSYYYLLEDVNRRIDNALENWRFVCLYGNEQQEKFWNVILSELYIEREDIRHSLRTSYDDLWDDLAKSFQD